MHVCVCGGGELIQNKMKFQVEKKNETHIYTEKILCLTKLTLVLDYLWSFKKIERKKGRKQGQGEERKSIKREPLYIDINEKAIILGSRYPETTFSN